MQHVSLAAESRTNTGKGAARSLRREGKVPAVIYGHALAARPLAVEHRALGKLLEIDRRRGSTARRVDRRRGADHGAGA